MNLIVSLATYNEIAELLQAMNISTKDKTEITLQAGTQLKPPLDFRVATMRRDACGIAAQVYPKTEEVDRLINFAETIHQYILTGKIVEQKQKEEWK